MNHLTIILKPTNRCNAHCLYCSAWNPGQHEPVMTGKSLEVLFERLQEWVVHSRQNRRIKIIWHGGEPLIMPPSFYYHAIALERELEKCDGVEIENNMQSNLLCLDNERLDMLEQLLTYKKSKRTMGTSYDPIPDIRVYRGGDYNEKWEQAVKLLESRDFPYGIVYVVHRRSLEQVERVAEVFLEKFPGIGIRFNPLYKEGRAINQACEPLYITPGEWGDFLVKLYGIWERHEKKPSWQPLKEIDMFHFGQDNRMSCDLVGKCGTTHLGIDTDGTVYCCGRGIDRKYKSFGNIHEDKMAGILKHPNRKEMANRAAFLEQTYCSDCKWWRYCHGGCPMDAAINNQDNIFCKTNFCLSRQYFLETVYKEPNRQDKKEDAIFKNQGSSEQKKRI